MPQTIDSAYKELSKNVESFDEITKIWTDENQSNLTAAMVYFYLAFIQCQIKLQKLGAFDMLQHGMDIANHEANGVISHARENKLTN